MRAGIRSIGWLIGSQWGDRAVKIDVIAAGIGYLWRVCITQPQESHSRFPS